MPTLALDVNVRNPADNALYHYSAGDSAVPDWAQRLISNGAAWVGGVAPYPTPDTNPAATVKAPVRAATTVNITLSGTQTIDGVALVAKDAVLVKNQTAGADNGVYVVASGAWKRRGDLNTGPSLVAALVAVLEGGQAETEWIVTTPDPITLGTTAITWAKIAAATVHTHPETDVTGLTADLAAKAASAHSHAESDVTGLSTDLAAKAVPLTPTATKTTDYAAAVNDLVRADPSQTLREVYDAVTTSGSPTVTSATLSAVRAPVVGEPVAGLGIPLNSFVGVVNSGTSIGLSSSASSNVPVNATATATGVTLTVGTGVLTVTVPTGAPVGSVVAAKNMGATSKRLVVVPSGGDTIDGLTSVALAGQYSSRRFRKDSATTWVVEDGLSPMSSVSGAPMFPIGLIVNVIGDSVAPQLAGAAHSMNGSGAASDFLWWAHLLSNARLLYGKPAGIGSQRADMMAARIHADALSEGGHFCIIQTGTNDASAGFTAAQYAAYIRAMVASVLAAGQRPILTTPVPNNTATYRKLMDQYRRFVVSYAQSNGYPLVDFWSVLVDPATQGAYLSAYDNGDGIHPNNAGKKLMGQAILDALSQYLPTSPPPVQMVNIPATSSINAVPANATIDSSSLLANGLFLTDSNSDGVPDGWIKSGTQTYSIVTGDAAIKGNALRIQDAASSGFSQVATSNLGSSALQGHRIAFTGLVKVNTSAAAQGNLSCLSNGAVPMVLRALSLFVSAATPGWQRFYCEGAFPADGTTLNVNLNSNGGTSVDVEVAQLGVYDLTASGL